MAEAANASHVVIDDITVVIPTLGRDLLKGCLESIFSGSAWPHEVLVVNQGSNTVIDDWTRKALAAGFRMQEVRSSERGVAAGRNRGLECVSTRFVALVDDDCLVDGEWLTLLDRHLRRCPDAILTGMVLPEPGAVVPSVIESPHPRIYTRRLLSRDPLFPNNAGAALRTMQRVGPFDEHELIRYAEDNDWSYRALRLGIPIAYVPDVVVTHLDWRTEAERARIYQGYGYSQGAFYAKHLRQGDWFIAIRAVYDLLRGPWMWLRGTVQGNRDLVAYGKAYMTRLPAGIAAGFRQRSQA